MIDRTPTDLETAAERFEEPGDPFERDAATLRELTRGLHRGVTVTSFLVAILLPAAYLPLVAAELVVPVDPWLVAGLLGLHIACLVLGHGYRPKRTRGSP